MLEPQYFVRIDGAKCQNNRQLNIQLFTFSVLAPSVFMYSPPPRQAPTIGPTVYTQAEDRAAPFHPAASVTKRGPRSRAGLSPQPLTPPNTATRVPTVAPINAGAAASGTVLLGSVIPKTEKAKTPVAHISTPNAAAGVLKRAVLGTIPKAPLKMLHPHSMVGT